ncbi:MAG: glycosyltransferase family 2 protein [Chloroflexi bacterium]|nr:glycosyltransferase family 2 protein [Chloroflexota bacterium]
MSPIVPSLAALFWLSVGSILYTYFGYPLLVTLLARLRPPLRFAEPKEDLPLVTLLIAAYNEELAIEEKIKNSLNLDYPKDRLQILIVNDGSSDRTRDILDEYVGRGIEAFHQPQRGGKMAAITRGVSEARGDIILFSDANNTYQANTIKQIIAPFSDPHISAVSGAKVIEKGDGGLGESEGLYWKYESFIKKQESRLGSCTSATGEILAIRKGKYVAPPQGIINDDFYIAMQVVRQGDRLVYAPEAKSSERVSPTAQDEIKRRSRINAGRYQSFALAKHTLPINNPLLMWQIFSHKFLRLMLPFLMIGAALTNLAIVLIPAASNNFWLILLIGQAAFYGLALLGDRLPKKSKLGRLLYLPAFLTNSNMASLQGFIRFLRGGQLHLWERIDRR